MIYNTQKEELRKKLGEVRMDWLSRVFSVGVLMASFVALSCDSEGEESTGGSGPVTSPQPSPQPPPERPTLGLKGAIEDQTAESISSTFYLLLVNHTEQNLAVLPTSTGGAFFLPSGLFRENRQYSLHVLDAQFQYLTVLDTLEESGIQPYFRYLGGEEGFVASTLVLVELDESLESFDARDRIYLKTPPLLTLQGSFLNDAALSATFPELLPRPETTRNYLLSSQLHVQDGWQAYYSFLQRLSYPELYAKALINDLSLSIRLDFQTSLVRDVRLVPIGEQLQQAYLLGEPSRLWRQQAFELPSLPQDEQGDQVSTGYSVEAEFRTSSLTQPGQTFLIRLSSLQEGQRTYPMVLRRALRSPPLVDVWRVGSIINDLMSLSGRNGYLAPLCLRTPAASALTETLQLGVQAPVLAGVQTPLRLADYTAIEVQWSYLDANRTVLDPLLSDFPEGFRVNVIDGAPGLIRRTWTPSSRTVRYDFSGTSQGGERQELTLFSELFPETLAAGVVRFYRLRVRYRGEGFDASSQLELENCVQ